MLCICGLINNLEINGDLSLISLFEPVDFGEIDFDSMLVEDAGGREVGEIALMDCAESKLNCVGVVREIFCTILQVGVFIHD